MIQKCPHDFEESHRRNPHGICPCCGQPLDTYRRQPRGYYFMPGLREDSELSQPSEAAAPQMPWDQNPQPPQMPWQPAPQPPQMPWGQSPQPNEPQMPWGQSPKSPQPNEPQMPWQPAPQLPQPNEPQLPWGQSPKMPWQTNPPQQQPMPGQGWQQFLPYRTIPGVGNPPPAPWQPSPTPPSMSNPQTPWGQTPPQMNNPQMPWQPAPQPPQMGTPPPPWQPEPGTGDPRAPYFFGNSEDEQQGTSAEIPDGLSFKQLAMMGYQFIPKGGLEQDDFYQENDAADDMYDNYYTPEVQK